MKNHHVNPDITIFLAIVCPGIKNEEDYNRKLFGDFYD